MLETLRRRTAWLGLRLFLRYSRGVPGPAPEASAAGRAEGIFERAIASPLYQQALIPLVRLYFAYFDRPPDADGLRHWIERRLSGTPLDGIEAAFATSPEFAARVGSHRDEEFTRLLFRRMLGRDPEDEALAFWLQELRSEGVTRGDVVQRFANSPDFEAHIAPEVYVAVMYFLLLGRTPDPAGFAHWVDEHRAGRDPVSQVAGTAEFAARAAHYSPHA